MTKIHSPLFLLAALGALSLAQAADVDTSQWKCEKCPYPQGTIGEVKAGVGGVADKDSAAFGNYTGLQRKGAHLVLGGELTHRSGNGYFADLSASDLGLDVRRLAAQAGREGLYSLHLGYDQLPRYFAEGARTPFLGVGGSTLTLPAGFPAGTTGTMPLAATLQPVQPGFDHQRFELGGQWVGLQNWTWRVDLRRDVHDGTRPTYGSFFSTASQLVAQVDQTTDQLEVSASYVMARWHATLGYRLSQFRNGADALTWSNPFTPVGGGTVGQLALAPDNRFHQLFGSAGLRVTPMIHASADFALGEGQQDEAFLAGTLNPGLAVALPRTSLDGKVRTYHGSVKVSAQPLPALRLSGQYTYDERSNETPVVTMPQVSTDMFAAAARISTPFSTTQDRFKLAADFRGIEKWKFSAGVDWDQRERTYHAAVRTRETTGWLRASWQALEGLSLSADVARGDRSASSYGVAFWFPPENPLARKTYLADRIRDRIGARIDWTVNEHASIGISASYSNDDYDETVIGLNEVETVGGGIDLSLAMTENTKLHAFAQGERMRSRQTGSQLFGAPDWSGALRDRFEVLGVGIRHALIPDKLDIGADASMARSRSRTTVQTALGEPPYPTDKTARDVLKLFANYKLNDKLTLDGSYWYETYDSTDWHFDGLAPDTVASLLLLGAPPPRYTVHVLRLGLRYRF